MRYWFDANKETAFALEVAPPDGQGILEIDEATFKEIVDAQPAPAAVQPVTYVMRPDTFARPTIEGEPNPRDEPGLVDAKVLAPMEELARIWRKMQDARDAIMGEANRKDAEIKAEQKQIGTALLDAMNKMGGLKLLTAAGQIEKKRKVRANAKDWAAIYRFILENKAWGLLHKRLTDTFAEEWAHTHDAPPPGIDLFTEWTINVKKPGTRDVPSSED